MAAHHRGPPWYARQAMTPIMNCTGLEVSKALWEKYLCRHTDIGIPMNSSEIDMKIASWYRLMIRPVKTR